MEIFYSFILKLLLLIKPSMPVIAGSFFNAMILHYAYMRGMLKRMNYIDKLVSLTASILMGYGALYIITALYEYKSMTMPNSLSNAVLFTGSALGLETILWLIIKTNKATLILEDKLLRKINKITGEKNDD